MSLVFLNKLFNPQAIVFIDISLNKKDYSRKILENLISSGYLGRIFVVNDKAKKISKFLSYKNVLQIPSQIDLALIFSEVENIPKVLEECAEKKISQVIIFSDWDKIKNPLNQNYHQEKIIQKAQELGISLLGINSQGIINFEKKLNLTPHKNKIPEGEIGFINFECDLEFINNQIFQYNLGISKIINLGKSFGIKLGDVLNFLEQDKKTKIISLFYNDEKISELDLMTIKRISLKKPVVIFSVHGNNLKIFKKADAITTDSLQEFFTIIKILQHFPTLNSKSFGIISWDKNIAEIIINKIKKQKLILSAIAENPVIFNKNNMENFKTKFLNLSRDKNLENIMIAIPDNKFLEIIEEKSKKFRKNYFILSFNKIKTSNSLFVFDNIELFLKAFKKILKYKDYIKLFQSQKRLFFFRNKINRELKLKI